jgi:predicted metalloprotease
MGFGGGGGGLGLILSLVGSKFGILGVLVVLGGAWLFGGLGSIMGGGGSGVVSPGAPSGQSAANVCSASAEATFSCRVLASTEDTWGAIFQKSGQTYKPTTMVIYTGGTQSGCGAAQSTMGPFYCPTDERVYLDTTFFNELSTKFGAAGDFAQAYVIAHEVGHHLQHVLGTAGKVRAVQQRGSKAEGNAMSVKLELQADCYAGVWAANNRDRIEPGDVQEGLRAAQAIGDDTLQKAGQGVVVPESFTHGTSAQRQFWLKRGLETGDPARCDTFAEGAAA